MKKIKKILAMIMAMAMVMGLGMTAMADDDTPAPQTGLATVKGVTEEGAVVTAYQLVTYNAAGGYEVVDSVVDSGYTVGSRNPEIVAALAQQFAGTKGLDFAKDQVSGDYTRQLEAGTYLILVTNTGKTIYNPMLLSLEVKYPDGVQSGEVDADSKYTVEGTEVYAKSTDDVTVDKNIVTESGSSIGKHDDVFAGQTVYFKLSGTIPSYSKQYVGAVYTINDELSEGLTIDIEAVENTIVDQLERAGVTNLEDVTVSVEAQKITIAFDSEYILNNGLKKIEVTYPATVNGKESNFDPATNTVYPTYSNNPSDTADGTPKETKHYTFDLKQELVKTDDENNKLEGAEFKLTKDDKEVAGASVVDGWIEFKGLDAGTYTLTETKAPAGYQLSGKTYTVIIEAEYNTDDTLKNYTVTTKDGDDVIGTIEYTGTNTSSGPVAEILNTKLAELPSTGGIGTTIFTIGGIVIMIGAAALFFANRRKNNA